LNRTRRADTTRHTLARGSSPPTPPRGSRPRPPGTRVTWSPPGHLPQTPRAAWSRADRVAAPRARKPDPLTPASHLPKSTPTGVTHATSPSAARRPCPSLLALPRVQFLLSFSRPQPLPFPSIPHLLSKSPPPPHPPASQPAAAAGHPSRPPAADRPQPPSRFPTAPSPRGVPARNAAATASRGSAAAPRLPRFASEGARPPPDRRPSPNSAGISLLIRGPDARLGSAR
jgi:hypothetical protein